MLISLMAWNGVGMVGNSGEQQGSYLHEVTSANSNIQSGLPTFVPRLLVSPSFTTALAVCLLVTVFPSVIIFV